jgi:predicted ester cyclase
LLQRCPGLRLLVTSRQALGLPGEIVRPMLSLALPAPQAPTDLALLAQVEAVALFLDRAAALAPKFTLTAANAPSVIQICRLLDGMPLAIEPAAARVPVLSVAQIAERLVHSLRLLAAGPRLGLPRHQTIRAAIDWSYALLTEPERVLWRRLSVFRGTFSLAAAETICSDQVIDRRRNLPSSYYLITPPTHRPIALSPCHILDLLTQLVQKSLVLVTRGEGEARYVLLGNLADGATRRNRQFDMASLPMRSVRQHTTIEGSVAPRTRLDVYKGLLARLKRVTFSNRRFMPCQLQPTRCSPAAILRNCGTRGVWNLSMNCWRLAMPFTTPAHRAGIAGEKQAVGLYRTAFPALHFTIEDLIVEGDRVVVRWPSRGTHLGELMGMPPTGQQRSPTGISILHCAGGKICEHWHNWDTLGLMQQLGVIPQPA